MTAGRPATPSPGVLRTLEVLSILELATLATLLVNLVTVHVLSITAALGPVHGAVYLRVVAVVLMAHGLLPRTRAMAIIPAVGGVLTLLNVRAERRRLPHPRRVC